MDSPQPPKPRSQSIRSGLTRLPDLTFWRRIARRFLKWLARLVIVVFTRPHLCGLENFSQKGPFLVVFNHLGDADVVLGLAFMPEPIEALGKMELYDFPLLGKILDAYGVIWVHRGLPDRLAIRAALEGLQAGRSIGIAPEGRESLTGALEEGTQGSAYLALKAGVPLLPITFTGTENERIYGNLKRLRRTEVSMTVGRLFHIERLSDFRESVDRGTQTIMRTLARQLPDKYRGIYGEDQELDEIERSYGSHQPPQR